MLSHVKFQTLLSSILFVLLVIGQFTPLFTMNSVYYFAWGVKHSIFSRDLDYKLADTGLCVEYQNMLFSVALLLVASTTMIMITMAGGGLLLCLLTVDSIQRSIIRIVCHVTVVLALIFNISALGVAVGTVLSTACGDDSMLSHESFKLSVGFYIVCVATFLNVLMLALGFRKNLCGSDEKVPF